MTFERKDNDARVVERNFKFFPSLLGLNEDFAKLLDLGVVLVT